jgi:hypothetical protein
VKPAAASLAALVLAGGACNVTTDASRALVTYRIAAHPCAPDDCTLPDDSTGINGADRGDTVWVFSGVEGGNPVLGDSALVTVRAGCAENLVLLGATGTVRTFPSPITCRDSVFTRFVRRPPDPVEYRYFQWVVDSILPVGIYTLEGRMLVSPDLRPAFNFEVR